ncbi:hypothetical protein AWM70_01680 [Paenibacillus yonginensis]|uniref:Uncharacterized protein n=1 Tax=Paenibacillus yonginensis TaxID=1462996 RepID=A0A1B1MW91_9BACL|nr:hypothetical protein [Paenibacillus yonginensis]ANS73450.1 hypothetical protein AWM70_01680 [Paenibacillus yonginensis]
MENKLLLEAFGSGQITDQQMDNVMETLANGLLLYDEGSSITADDFLSRLEFRPAGAQLAAAKEFFALAVQLCRRFRDEQSYETLQDCLSLQLDLWRADLLDLKDWLAWLEQAVDGQMALPDYDFPALLQQPHLPDGFMIQDFHDLLLGMLEAQPGQPWAVQQRNQLYERLGVGRQ